MLLRKISDTEDYSLPGSAIKFTIRDIIRLMRAFFILLAIPLSAQPDQEAFQRMLESKQAVTQYLVNRASVITKKAVTELASPQTWEPVRAKRLEEMRDMLGLLPWPARTPLNVRITGTLDKGDYTVEKIVFESMPKIYVTGNLYLPKKHKGKLPAIVYVCGHAYSPHGDKTIYQRHGISFAKNGYVAIILDSIQISETFALHHGVGWQEMPDWYARGYTPAGVEVWNAMRAIDYLETRSEVDKNRIGMTGRSGGAAMSWFTAAVDQRVQAVAPVMGISTYEANVKNNTQRLHCDCMFAINSYMHDMMHQGALIAPKPLLMAHGKKDDLFPVVGYEDFEHRISSLYTGYGKQEFFSNVVVDTGHEDSTFLREKVIRFFDKQFLQKENRNLDMDYSDAPEDQLDVFAGNVPADAMNFRVHETFTTPAVKTYRSASEWQARAAQLLPTLREKVFAGVKAPSTAPQWKVQGKTNGFDVLQWQSEPGILLRGLMRSPTQASGKAAAVLYIASDGDDPQAVQALFYGVSARTKAIQFVVYPRGIGEIGWPKSFAKDTLRNAMHTGQTIDSMRLTDVLSAIAVLRQQPNVDPLRIMILGRGVAGAIGLYAALLDPRIEQVTLLDPPSSHVEGPIFLNVLRHTDITEAAALLAPRRLNFYGRMPAAFERTKNLYALLGLADHVFLTMSLEGPLLGKYDHRFASGL